MWKTALLTLLAVIFVWGCSNDNGTDPMGNNDGNPNSNGNDGPTGDMPNIGNGNVTLGATPCEGGMASVYPCDGYDLLFQMNLAAFNGNSGNDIWGWTDTTTNREYAVVGLDNGTAFVDITDAGAPVYLGKLMTATTAILWRDVKVYGDYALIVSEAPNHGMQVFDLKRLRNVANPPEVFTADARYTGIGNAHNLVINEENAFAYIVGTARNDAFNGGVHFIDIQNPSSPSAAGGYGANGYTHDAQVVTYNGPDADYTGREIFIGANEDQIAIVDVTDKSNPVEIETLTYSDLGYTHQGWFTEDQRYFLLGDELDELQIGVNSKTLVFDFLDLDNPVLHTTYEGPTGAIDHNGYVLGDEFFLANYAAGIRVLDISDIANQNITEKAFFDTYPANNTAGFDGVWSVYPYFESGKILVNDTASGLFVLQKSN
ncbi:choice-of-anchor B family protein [Flagellimonas meishanensis]|uniref:choice-of-anchor B family protein n=1 Tax=Flagellimonas meishanensis TaxID=2873264 RepID=UPI001CA78BB4|nr:choice-of-anchor B family protein [[Muricauda] meishanensis]